MPDKLFAFKLQDMVQQYERIGKEMIDFLSKYPDGEMIDGPLCITWDGSINDNDMSDFLLKSNVGIETKKNNYPSACGLHQKEYYLIEINFYEKRDFVIGSVIPWVYEILSSSINNAIEKLMKEEFHVAKKEGANNNVS